MEFINAYTFGFCEKQGFTRKAATWKHSLRLRIESACVADLFLSENTPQPVHNIMAGQAFLFINIDSYIITYL